MTLKQVDVDISEMSIVEDSQYQVYLARKEGEEWQVSHLYEVVVMSVNTIINSVVRCDTVYVLAADEVGAESQASCIVAKKIDKSLINMQLFCKAKQVPFGIRGWSSTEF